MGDHFVYPDLVAVRERTTCKRRGSKPEDRANVMEFMASYGGAPAKPEPVAPEAEDAGEDAPGAGQGPVEGAEAGAAESATGMSADQPVPAANAATNTDAATKVDE